MVIITPRDNRIQILWFILNKKKLQVFTYALFAVSLFLKLFIYIVIPLHIFLLDYIYSCLYKCLPQSTNIICLVELVRIVARHATFMITISVLPNINNCKRRFKLII